MKDEPDAQAQGYKSILGVDYGPVNSDRSNTVAVVAQARAGKKIHIVHMKKFLGKEADYSFIHRELPKMFHT